MKSFKPNLMASPFYYVIYTIICYITFVLFGAPVLSKHFETLFLASLFAFLSGAPFLFNFHVTAEKLNSVLWFPSSKAEYFTCCSFWGTLVGNWSSAFFLVLDWDRPWQAWPIPCVFGSFFGFLMGLLMYLIRPFAAPACTTFFQQALDTTDLVKVRFD
ncbi:hypothetical protein ACTXT7_015708 [Hymenolepis weldensis]